MTTEQTPAHHAAEKTETQALIDALNNNSRQIEKQRLHDKCKNYTEEFNKLLRETPEKKEIKIIPLSKKINWIESPEKLRSHLKILHDNDFIGYDNIESILSGSEVAFFIKHKKGECKSILNNATGLFRFWSTGGFIDGYFEKIINQNTGNQTEIEHHSLIEDSFCTEAKGNEFKKDTLKGNAGQAERENKIERIKKHFESLLK